jgi:hypothetical protein
MHGARLRFTLECHARCVKIEILDLHHTLAIVLQYSASRGPNRPDEDRTGMNRAGIDRKRA